MPNTPSFESLPATPVAGNLKGIGRRRLLRAGLAATPVVLAVSGRSAMATNACTGLSPLAWNSAAPNGVCVGTSHTIQGNTLGRTPTYWKPNTSGGQTFRGPWPNTCKPFITVRVAEDDVSWNGSNWATFANVAKDDPGWVNGTKFKDLFPGASDQRSVSQILIQDNATVIWNLCAAYLNAASMAGTYALTIQEVISLASGTLGNKQLVTDSEIKSFLSQTWA